MSNNNNSWTNASLLATTGAIVTAAALVIVGITFWNTKRLLHQMEKFPAPNQWEKVDFTYDPREHHHT